jgi:hypothetical protein
VASRKLLCLSYPLPAHLILSESFPTTQTSSSLRPPWESRWRSIRGADRCCPANERKEDSSAAQHVLGSRLRTIEHALGEAAHRSSKRRGRPHAGEAREEGAAVSQAMSGARRLLPRARVASIVEGHALEKHARREPPAPKQHRACLRG